MAELVAGVYFIVSVYKAEGWCVDKPSELGDAPTGALQKYWPTAGHTQKWEFVPDPDSPGFFRIRWAYADRFVLEMGDTLGNGFDRHQVYFHSDPGGSLGSWRPTTTASNKWSLSNRATGFVLDYWSSNDHERGPLFTKRYIGVRQQEWYLQHTEA